ASARATARRRSASTCRSATRSGRRSSACSWVRRATRRIVRARASRPSLALLLQDAFEDLGGALERGQLLLVEMPQPLSQVGVLARPEALDQARAVSRKPYAEAAPVERVALANHEALLLERRNQPRGRGALDALDLGEPAGRERPVALDRGQRGYK